MSRTYTSDQIDPLLEDLYGQIEGALEIAKQATTRAEAAESRATALEGEKQVVLEKVASAKLDDTLIDETLQTLEDLQILKPGGREKIASDIGANPNNALHLLQKVVTLSARAHNEGTGVPKSAAAKTNQLDPDGWADVIRNGAN